MKVQILGAGIAGISLAYHLNEKGIDYSLFEARKTWGGLLDSFEPYPGYIFDRFIHLSFTNNQYVRSLFDKSVGSIIHDNPKPYNLDKGLWLKHPVQFNLAPLGSQEKVQIIKGFIDADTNKEINNYEDWLIANYGNAFADRFPKRYTRKYWTLPANKLSTDWVSSRMAVPNIEQVLSGSYQNQEENFYYAKSMRYPIKGGYKSYLKHMTLDLDISTDKRAIDINLETKKITFKDGSSEYFDVLASTIPAPELIKIIRDVPNNIIKASKKLVASSGQLVSMGFKKEISDHLWYYIYDEDFLPARAYSPSLKSPNNVPAGKGSVQFETYYSKFKKSSMGGDQMIDHITKKATKLNLFDYNDIDFVDYREEKYANVIYDHERKRNLKIVLDYLDSKNIFYCGRFGLWEYLWSDQSLLSGKKLASKINKL